MNVAVDLYQVLSIDPTATIAQIRVAYRHKAKECHPDCGGSHAQMIAVIEAWEVLSDPFKRAAYDQMRSAPADALSMQRWQTVGAEANTAAKTAADTHGRSWAQFQQWMDRVAADVHREPRGRAAVGALVGILLGGIIGAVAGPLIGIGFTGSVIVGIITGATSAMIAGIMSKPASAGAEN